jgi:hypothetical protein
MTIKNKNPMPNHSILTTRLATEAFKIIGKDEFTVSACLNADKPKSLENFGILQSILLAAYESGQKNALEQLAKPVLVSCERMRQHARDHQDSVTPDNLMGFANEIDFKVSHVYRQNEFFTKESLPKLKSSLGKDEELSASHCPQMG